MGLPPPNPRLPFLPTASCGASWLFPVKTIAVSPEELLRIAASVESGFSHSVANTIVTYTAEHGEN